MLTETALNQVVAWFEQFEVVSIHDFVKVNVALPCAQCASRGN